MNIYANYAEILQHQIKKDKQVNWMYFFIHFFLGLGANKFVEFAVNSFKFSSFAQIFNGWYVAFEGGRSSRKLKFEIKFNGDYFTPQQRFDL